MRALIQRVSSAAVRVDGVVVGRCDPQRRHGNQGLLVLLGVHRDDTAAMADSLAAKAWGLRILHDQRSASEVDAPILVVSQFTLYADLRKGRRPSWGAAATGADAEPVVQRFCQHLRELGATVQTGAFGADMQVSLVNDGPVTILLDSEDLARPRRSRAAAEGAAPG
jgi:D-tyrosyl-tRNA(Tyr) deacylase